MSQTDARAGPGMIIAPKPITAQQRVKNLLIFIFLAMSLKGLTTDILIAPSKHIQLNLALLKHRLRIGT